MLNIDIIACLGNDNRCGKVPDFEASAAKCSLVLCSFSSSLNIDLLSSIIWHQRFALELASKRIFNFTACIENVKRRLQQDPLHAWFQSGGVGGENNVSYK